MGEMMLLKLRTMMVLDFREVKNNVVWLSILFFYTDIHTSPEIEGLNLSIFQQSMTPSAIHIREFWHLVFLCICWFWVLFPQVVLN